LDAPHPLANDKRLQPFAPLLVARAPSLGSINAAQTNPCARAAVIRAKPEIVAIDDVLGSGDTGKLCGTTSRDCGSPQNQKGRNAQGSHQHFGQLSRFLLGGKDSSTPIPCRPRSVCAPRPLLPLSSGCYLPSAIVLQGDGMTNFSLGFLHCERLGRRAGYGSVCSLLFDLRCFNLSFRSFHLPVSLTTREFHHSLRMNIVSGVVSGGVFRQLLE
jgi:hypothetical protein